MTETNTVDLEALADAIARRLARGALAPVPDGAPPGYLVKGARQLLEVPDASPTPLMAAPPFAGGVPPVAANELIEAAWGNTVAAGVNNLLRSTASVQYKPTGNLDAWAGGTWSPWLPMSVAIPTWATTITASLSTVGVYAVDAYNTTYEVGIGWNYGGATAPVVTAAYLSNPSGSYGQLARFSFTMNGAMVCSAYAGTTASPTVWIKRVGGTGYWRADIFSTAYGSFTFSR